MTEICSRALKSNGNFAIVKEPYKHMQHPNQQGGLDVYVDVLNISSGIICQKKLYENTKGLHFKHTGYSPAYLSEFTKDILHVPYQILEV